MNNYSIKANRRSSLFGLKGIAIKAKLAKKTPILCVGMWFPCPLIAEMIATESVDALVLDLEHGPWDTASITQLLVATASSPVAIVARPGKLDAAQIQLLLDLGIDGLMVGHCDSLEVAREAVALCKYAPLGRRGVGPTRAGAYLRDMPGYLKEANKATMLWIQVEQKVKTQELEEMLGLPGVDALMVGPCDMAVSIGHLTDWEHPDVVKLVKETVGVAHRLGKPFGVPGKIVKHQLIDLIASDIGSLQAGLQQVYKQWRAKRGK